MTRMYFYADEYIFMKKLDLNFSQEKFPFHFFRKSSIHLVKIYNLFVGKFSVRNWARKLLIELLSYWVRLNDAVNSTNILHTNVICLMIKHGLQNCNGTWRRHMDRTQYDAWIPDRKTLFDQFYASLTCWFLFLYWLCFFPYQFFFFFLYCLGTFPDKMGNVGKHVFSPCQECLFSN